MSVPHTLLRLLMEGPTHGYELRRKLSGYPPLLSAQQRERLSGAEGSRGAGLRVLAQRAPDSRRAQGLRDHREGRGRVRGTGSRSRPSRRSPRTDLIALKLVMAPSRGGARLAPRLAFAQTSPSSTRDRRLARIHRGARSIAARIPRARAAHGGVPAALPREPPRSTSRRRCGSRSRVEHDDGARHRRLPASSWPTTRALARL